MLIITSTSHYIINKEWSLFIITNVFPHIQCLYTYIFCVLAISSHKFVYKLLILYLRLDEKNTQFWYEIVWVISFLHNF